MTRERSATVGEDEIKRFRVGDILFNDEQAKMFCDLAMKGLRAEMAPARLDAILDEIDEFLEDQQDVRDGADGVQLPNKAMSLLQELRDARTKSASWSAEGWKLVPETPTPHQIAMAIVAIGMARLSSAEYQAIYTAMLNAAPQERNRDGSGTPAVASPAVAAPDPAKRCGLRFKTECPNMKMRDDNSMEGETYQCAVCGDSVFLDYEEMK